MLSVNAESDEAKDEDEIIILSRQSLGLGTLTYEGYKYIRNKSNQINLYLYSVLYKQNWNISQ